MARPKLVSPDQPLFVRFVLRLYELGASLQLAVFLLFSMAGTLALATAVEATFSTAVVQYAVYQSWWFNLLYCLLAVNIFCAASIRYPWKKHQTGFVITHIGLMILLFSGVVSRLQGIDSQVHVWENDSSSLAFDDSYYFRLETTPKGSADPHASNSAVETVQKTIQPIAFKPGAFSWSDYQDGFVNLQVANSNVAGFFSPLFYLAKRNDSGDVLYHKNGVKLEVIDFYADADWKENTPTVEIRIGMPAMKQQDSQGRMVESKQSWVPAELSVQTLKEGSNYKYGFGGRQRMGGGSFTFSMSGTRAATEAFLDSAPEGEIGPQGQVVLHAQGKKVVLDVEQALTKEVIAIEGTDLSYHVTDFMKDAQAARAANGKLEWTDNPTGTSIKNPAVKIEITRGDDEVGQLVLLADMPDVNLQAYDAGVYGDFWFDHGEKSSAELMKGEGGSRIDIIQGVAEGVSGEEASLIGSKRLYYRYWNRKEVVTAEELPIEGNPDNAVDAFTMPIGTLKMYIKNFIPSDRPKGQPVAIAFAPGKPFMQPAAKVRLTVEDKEPEEFWLWAHINDPTSGYFEGITQKKIDLGDKVIALSMPIQSTDIGFRIYLEKFERKLDPGTTQASHYSSDVHYLDSRRDRTIMTAGGAYKTPHALLIQGMINPSSPVIHGDKIYWIDNGNVSGRSLFMAQRDEGSSNAYGMATEIVSFAAFDPQSLVINPENQKIYWTDLQSGRASDLGLIREASLDGSEVRTVATFAGEPQGIAVDSKKKIVFFTDNSSGNIGRVLIDGSELNADWITEKGHATGIAIDPVNEKVYWSDNSRNSIRYALYSGEYKGAAYNGTEGKGIPNSLAIDVKKQVLYWTDIAANPLNPNAAKYRNDRTIDRDVQREKLTRVRRFVIGENEPKNISVKLLDNPGDAFFDAASGQLYWTQADLLKSDVWVTMNAPDVFVDPTHGRQLRVFQESFDGPYRPGSRSYQTNVPVSSNVPEVYKSVFSVNYDPGTPLRYWGCFLVCVGIASMFYMRAYFFTSKRKTN